MTARDAAKLMNRPGMLTTAEGLRVAVTILDYKQSWGQGRVLVKPVSGEGEAWVSTDRVTF